MHRRHIDLPPLARACQAGALLLILFGILILLVHSTAVDGHRGPVAGTFDLQAR